MCERENGNVNRRECVPEIVHMSTYREATDEELRRCVERDRGEMRREIDERWREMPYIFGELKSVEI